MTADSSSTSSGSSRPRVAARVGLTLLEVIRHQDLPTEILEAEDPSITMPRRLGLSEVIDRQIRSYREDVRKGRRLSDDQMRDLVRLVIRRPDAEEVFFRAGVILSSKNGGGGSRGPLRRLLPRTVSFALARRRARRRLRRLFGRRIGGFGAGPFTLEARAHILIDSDPGGEACAFATGLCEAVVQRYAGRTWRLAHTQCQGRGDPLCRWNVLAEEPSAAVEEVGELVLNPEPGTP